MRTALILLLAVAIPALGAQTQTVWKWVDDRGVTHYSDTPVPGATRVELSVSGSRARPADAPSAQTARPASPSPSQQTPAAPAESPYRNFEIWKPLQEETIANTGGVVQANVRVDPALSSQHRLNLYLDGKLVEGFPRNSQSFELKDVPRGMHTLVAVIMDPAGTKLAQTAQITFHVRQESAAQPPVGPSLRPPPKPTPRASNKLPTSQPSYSALNGGRRTINPATNLPTRPATPNDTGPR